MRFINIFDSFKTKYFCWAEKYSLYRLFLKLRSSKIFRPWIRIELPFNRPPSSTQFKKAFLLHNIFLFIWAQKKKALFMDQERIIFIERSKQSVVCPLRVKPNYRNTFSIHPSLINWRLWPDQPIMRYLLSCIYVLLSR